jgi:phage shock protein A
MQLTLTTALVGVLITLVGALIALTWRSATLATQLLEAIKHLRGDTDDLKSRTKALEMLPNIEQRLVFVERHLSEIPKAMSRITVLEEAQKFSKEMRKVLLRQSRPHINDEED